MVCSQVEDFFAAAPSVGGSDALHLLVLNGNTAC